MQHSVQITFRPFFFYLLFLERAPPKIRDFQKKIKMEIPIFFIWASSPDQQISKYFSAGTPDRLILTRALIHCYEHWKKSLEYSKISPKIISKYWKQTKQNNVQHEFWWKLVPSAICGPRPSVYLVAPSNIDGFFSNHNFYFYFFFSPAPLHFSQLRSRNNK